MAAHKLYAPNRKTSVVVATRYKPVHENHATRKAAMDAKPMRGKEGKNAGTQQQNAKPHHGNRADKPYPSNQGGGRKQGGKPAGAGGRGGKKR